MRYWKSDKIRINLHFLIVIQIFSCLGIFFYERFWFHEQILEIWIVCSTLSYILKLERTWQSILLRDQIYNSSSWCIYCVIVYTIKLHENNLKRNLWSFATTSFIPYFTWTFGHQECPIQILLSNNKHSWACLINNWTSKK